jgi:hypothetical protein
MAHSIIIESLDDSSLSEQWIRSRRLEKHSCLEGPKGKKHPATVISTAR